MLRLQRLIRTRILIRMPLRTPLRLRFRQSLRPRARLKVRPNRQLLKSLRLDTTASLLKIGASKVTPPPHSMVVTKNTFR